MASAPVLVKAYDPRKAKSLTRQRPARNALKALPPISSFAFENILQSIDSPDVQSAIDGIAKIWSKSHLSLADEYQAHMPPLGEITEASSAAMRPHLSRRGMPRVLTSVPEVSSSSSEASQRPVKRRSGFFGFLRQRQEQSKPLRQMRIGSMGRTLLIGSTTALITANSTVDWKTGDNVSTTTLDKPDALTRTTSQAESSLQRLLARSGPPPD